MKEHFLNWLSLRGCLDEFRANGGGHVLEDEDDFEEYINYAFSWVDTPQGHDFWKDIDQAWRREYKEYMCCVFYNFMQGHGYAHDDIVVDMGSWISEWGSDGLLNDEWNELLKEHYGY